MNRPNCSKAGAVRRGDPAPMRQFLRYRAPSTPPSGTRSICVELDQNCVTQKIAKRPQNVKKIRKSSKTAPFLPELAFRKHRCVTLPLYMDGLDVFGSILCRKCTVLRDVFVHFHQNQPLALVALGEETKNLVDIIGSQAMICVAQWLICSTQRPESYRNEFFAVK